MLLFGGFMATPEQVEAAGRRMSDAAEHLRAYDERPYSEPPDPDRHGLLTRALSDATDEYLRLLLELPE